MATPLDRWVPCATDFLRVAGSTSLPARVIVPAQHRRNHLVDDQIRDCYVDNDLKRNDR